MLTQLIDASIMDIETLQYQPRTIVASFIYLVVSFKSAIFSSETIRQMKNSSLFLLDRNQLHRLSPRIQPFQRPLLRIHFRHLRIQSIRSAANHPIHLHLHRPSNKLRQSTGCYHLAQHTPGVQLRRVLVILITLIRESRFHQKQIKRRPLLSLVTFIFNSFYIIYNYGIP